MPTDEVEVFMRSRVFCCVLALAAVSGPAAIAEEPALLDLSFPAVKWQKGDVTTLDGRRGIDMEFEPGGDRAKKKTVRYDTDGWICAIRADAVDSSGRMTKAVAFFESGFVQRKTIDEIDQSLSGARIEIDADQWSEAGGLRSPSQTVRRWLSERFMAKRFPAVGLDWAKALAPEKKVATGAEWTPDVAALAKHLSRMWDVELSAKGATGTCKLEEVSRRRKAPLCGVDVVLKFPIRRAPKDASGRRPRLPKDATIRVTMRCLMGLKDRLPFRQIMCDARYWGDADLRGPGRLNLSMHAAWGVDHDGEVPEPKR